MTASVLKHSPHAENTDARRTEVDMFLADTSRDIHCYLCRVAGNTV